MDLGQGVYILALYYFDLKTGYVSPTSLKKVAILRPAWGKMPSAPSKPKIVSLTSSAWKRERFP